MTRLWISQVCDRVFVPLGLGGFCPAKAGNMEAGGIEPPFGMASVLIPRGLKPRTHLVTEENPVERNAP